MVLELDHIKQSFFLLWGQIRFVSAHVAISRCLPASCKFGAGLPLGQDKQRLVPKNRHVTRVSLEANKVEDQSVYDLVRQGILLVKQHSDEQAVGACM